VLLAITLQFALPAAATLAPPRDDTYVVSDSANKNFGTDASIIVNAASIGLVQFDTSTLPANITAADVEKATLILFVNKVTTAGSINVLPVTATWTEEGVTYSTRPAVGAPVATFAIASASLNRFITVDVTNQVRSWVTTPGSNHGFELAGVGSTSVQFDTKEGTMAPTLDITVLAEGPAGAAVTVAVGTVTTGAAGSSAQVTNSGSSSAATLNFTIPRGDTGPQGAKGDKGDPGSAGPAGAPGTAATVTVGKVTTGAAGGSAQVTNTGTSAAAVLNFTIPQGPVGTGAVRLLDASNKYVGSFAGLDSAATLWTGALTSWVTIPLPGFSRLLLGQIHSPDGISFSDPLGVVPSFTPLYFYASDNCSGRPYTFVPTSNSLFLPVGRGVGPDLYFARDVADTTISVRSRRVVQSNCEQVSSYSLAVSSQDYTVLPQNLGFTPPFHFASEPDSSTRKLGRPR
jgi:hypothetical protein